MEECYKVGDERGDERGGGGGGGGGDSAINPCDMDDCMISPDSRAHQLVRQLQSLEWHVRDFRFLQVIGKGRASTAYRAIHACGVKFAVKKCHAWDAIEANRVKQEIEIHSSLLPHPDITSFYGSFRDDVGQVYMILEYAKRGDLFSNLYSAPSSPNLCSDDPRSAFVFSEAEVRERVVKPLISAVAYLHSRDIIHCDIKPENMLLNDMSQGFKLADFGFATDLKRNRANKRWGHINNEPQ